MALIHEKIAKVSKEAGGLLATTKQGSAIKFAYRGVDDVVGHVASRLNDEGVIYYPVSVQKDLTGRDMPGAKYLTTTSLVVTYEFVAAEDGSTIYVVTPGLAQDYADRSDAQAMSVSLRTALIQLFKLQGTGDPDPEQAGAAVERETAEAVAADKKASRASATPKAKTASQLAGDIQKIIADKSSGYDGPAVNALGAKHSGGNAPDQWMKDTAVLQKILDSIAAGELA